MTSIYVTTAIPYVNAEPHLGFALELVQADAIARYHRLRGADVRLLTGTDENSLTNVLAAERAGIPVRALVDRNAEVFRTLAGALDIGNDDFIRTSADPRHLGGARRLWEACVSAGDVYRRAYRGPYCVLCERFLAVDELEDGRCPEHDVTPEIVDEENYFFRLSRYADRLAALLDSGTLRVIPASRHHEARAFIARGLEDFSISRSFTRARGWGIPVPGDPDQVMYVWYDALANYITALGYGSDDGLYRRYWLEASQRIHVIGKDIVRFHAIYWPAMLLSAGAPPPTTIVVHGFLTRDGRRMSKTLGTGVDPMALVQRWGVDAVRYWTLREVPPTGDADYTETGFGRAYAGALANDLGNLLHRTASMLHRYRGGVVPGPAEPANPTLLTIASHVRAALDGAFASDWDPRIALDAIFAIVRRANQLVEETRPWALAKAERGGDPDARGRLDTVLWQLAESLRLVAEALRPLLPDTSGRIAAQLGITLAAWPRALEWGGLPGGIAIRDPTPLFPTNGVT
jgi:methionyl-tRNA synthetase